MYQALISRRYLTSKIMPLLASVAVGLCTMMVLVTWSVMGGFLKVLLESGRTLVGDVSIIWPNTGFAHYEDLIQRLERENSHVAGAAPIIETYGLLGLPDGRTPTVSIKGIDPARYDKVTDYASTLWWRPLEKPLRKDTERRDWRLERHDLWQQTLDNGLDMTRLTDRQTGAIKPAAVLGIEVSGFNIRLPSGAYVPGYRSVRTETGGFESIEDILPINGSVTIHVLPLDRRGRGMEMVARSFPVANEFKTGVYPFDKGTVFVPLAELQSMLKMDAARRLVREGELTSSASGASASPASSPIEIVVDPETGEERIQTSGQYRDDPSRVTAVLVRAAPGVSVTDLQQRCQEVYAQFAAAHPGEVPEAESIEILTWEQQNAIFIDAVKHEIALVLFLFSMISLVAVMLVLAIFWSMVSEKTKDIGVLRALGATRAGVAGMWLSYGLAIGLVGAVLGGVGSYLIVLNINPIHEWMGRAMNIQIWNPSVYYFTEIPSDVRADRAAIVLLGGVLSSVAGALVPAIRAAAMHPVRALRFE
ncbi:MAG: FtsX-like permease family protein [Planctomycetota bacterium]|nr:FtsX-like permease family protein [Planctomycetota bacterium]